jgi:hypothetical protein
MKNLVAGFGGLTPSRIAGVTGDHAGRLPSSDAAARKADSDPPAGAAGRRHLARS